MCIFDRYSLTFKRFSNHISNFIKFVFNPCWHYSTNFDYDISIEFSYYNPQWQLLFAQNVALFHSYSFQIIITQKSATEAYVFFILNVISYIVFAVQNHFFILSVRNFYFAAGSGVFIISRIIKWLQSQSFSTLIMKSYYL